MKPEIIIISLSGCSGCISTLISLDVFPQFFERTKISYFPFISDEDKIKDCDIALIEGCISSPSQIDLVKEIRKYAKNVYAIGTCSCFGGILSLSKNQNAEPISKYIQIDGIIPGCPPPSNLFGNNLIRLIENKELFLPEKNLCNDCPLRGNMEFNSPIDITRLFPLSENIEFPEEGSECFLKRGILCLGPIIRDGCEHVCIKKGIPCEGCMGTVSRDFASNVVNFLSLVNFPKKFRRYKGVFYRFSKPILKR